MPRLPDPDPCSIIGPCPICKGELKVVHDHAWKLQVCVCIECMTSVSIPSEAWDVARSKGVLAS